MPQQDFKGELIAGGANDNGLGFSLHAHDNRSFHNNVNTNHYHLSLFESPDSMGRAGLCQLFTVGVVCALAAAFGTLYYLAA